MKLSIVYEILYVTYHVFFPTSFRFQRWNEQNVGNPKLLLSIDI